MSTLESKLEAWLRYVAKQEEAIRQEGNDSSAEEAEEKKQEGPMAAAPAALRAYSPTPAPSPAPAPTATATISRMPKVDAAPEIPEVEDFLPPLRRRMAPPPIPEDLLPQVEDKPRPIISRPAPVPAAPLVPPAQEVPRPQPNLFAPAPQAPVRRARPEQTSVEPPAPVAESSKEAWDRLPRHVQLLVGMYPGEVAQRSYKQFKETREDLVQRLLDPTLSLEDAARVLNVCPTTVRRYTNKDALKHFRTAGNQRRFKLSDVLAFMESPAFKKAEQ